MSWDVHHSESERLAQQAEAAADADEARGLYLRAAEAEARALAETDPAKSRTRGITAVSALSLWFKAGRLDVVAAQGQALLADDSLPHFARAQIREILEQAGESGRGGQQDFEVEITFLQKMKYTIRAPDPVTAEKQAVTRWREGDESTVPASDGCELLEVHTHAAAGPDRSK